jgi:hypothetical protein
VIASVSDTVYTVDFLYQIDNCEDCAATYTSELWRIDDPFAEGEAEE